MSKASVVFLVSLILLPALAQAQDDPHNKRLQYANFLKDRVNDYYRHVYYIRVDSAARGQDSVGERDNTESDIGDAAVKALFESAASTLMQCMYLISACADCERYSLADCDTLSGLRETFASQIDSLKVYGDRLTVLRIQSDSLWELSGLIVANLDAFLVLECRGKE